MVFHHRCTIIEQNRKKTTTLPRQHKTRNLITVLFQQPTKKIHTNHLDSILPENGLKGSDCIRINSNIPIVLPAIILLSCLTCFLQIFTSITGGFFMIPPPSLFQDENIRLKSSREEHFKPDQYIVPVIQIQAQTQRKD